jgi:hypothetical protein
MVVPRKSGAKAKKLLTMLRVEGKKLKAHWVAVHRSRGGEKISRPSLKEGCESLERDARV